MSRLAIPRHILPCHISFLRTPRRPVAVHATTYHRASRRHNIVAAPPLPLPPLPLPPLPAPPLPPLPAPPPKPPARAASISRKLWRSPISAALVAIRAPPKKVSPAHRSLRRVFGFDAADLSHHADTEFQIASAISWSSAFGSGSSSTSAIALQTVSVCLHQRPARTPFHGSCDNCALRFGLKDTETFARQATCLHASRYLFLFYSQDALASSLSSIKSIGPSMHTWSSRGRHLVAGAIGIEATRGVARLDGVDGFRKSWRRWHTT